MHCTFIRVVHNTWIHPATVRSRLTRAEKISKYWITSYKTLISATLVCINQLYDQTNPRVINSIHIYLSSVITRLLHFICNSNRGYMGQQIASIKLDIPLVYWAYRNNNLKWCNFQRFPSIYSWRWKQIMHAVTIEMGEGISCKTRYLWAKCLIYLYHWKKTFLNSKARSCFISFKSHTI